MTAALLTLVTIIFLSACLLAAHHFFAPKREHEFEKRKQNKQWRPKPTVRPKPAMSFAPPLSSHTFPGFEVEDHPQQSYYSTSTVKVKSPANLDADFTKIYDDLFRNVNTNMDRQMKTLDQMMANLDKNLDRVTKATKNRTNSTGGR